MKLSDPDSTLADVDSKGSFSDPDSEGSFSDPDPTDATLPVPDLDALWLRTKSLYDTDHKQVADLISQLLSDQNQERLAAEKLFAFYMRQFPNILSVRLCEVFLRSENDPPIRSKAIMLLYYLLQFLGKDCTLLSIITVYELKPLLVQCLHIQETPEMTFKILSKVVSDIAVYVFTSKSSQWDDLRDYIVTTVDSNIRKVFILFHELPLTLNSEFLNVVMGKIFAAIVYRLDQEHPDFECDNWGLAFRAGFSFAVQMVESSRGDLSYNMMYAMVRSAVVMVDLGLERILWIALEGFEEVMMEKAGKFHREHFEIVSKLVHMIGEIQELGEDTKMAARRIYRRTEVTIQSRNRLGIRH